MNTPCMYCYANAEPCAAEGPHGFVCNRGTSHDGDHAACVGDDHPIDTWPQRGDTTGEVLARLQARLARLLDEADAELRDEADGGVTAALIEQEAEEPAPSVDYRAMWWKAEREREKAEQERDEARKWLRETEASLDEANGVVKSLRTAEPRPLAPDAITDEMVERTREAWCRAYDSAEQGIRAVLAAALTQRPEGAEELGELIGTWIATEDIAPAQLPTGSLATLADFLAQRGVRVVGKDGDPR